MDVKKDIFLLGISHHTAPVEIREQLVFAGEGLEVGLNDLIRRVAIDEAVVLCTCNRTEVYVAASPDEVEVYSQLEKFLQPPSGGDIDPDLFYFEKGQDAVNHLFSVAAGLDSLILGETQILGQVKDALQMASKAGAVGTYLERLFQQALVVGKKVRRNTHISRGAVSVAYAGVELALKIFRRVEDKKALLIGAGDTAELAMVHLRDRGVQNIWVANRTVEKAQVLAEKLDGEAVGLDRIPELLESVDMVLSATSSPDYILRADEVKDVLYRRSARPLLLVDLAVPRDFDPQLGRSDLVFLHDLDDLGQIIEHNLEQRRAQIPTCRAIIGEEVGRYYSWCHSLEVTPTIVALREKLEALRREELDKYAHQLGDDEQEILEKVTHTLINKILHGPLVQLKKYSNGTFCGLLRVKVAKELFELERKHEEHTSAGQSGK